MTPNSSRALGIVTALLALTVVPGSSLDAQACLGLPTPDGLVGLAVGMELADGVARYGGRLAANTEGRMALSGAFYVVQPRAALKSSHLVQASVALKTQLLGMSACPTVGASTSAGRVQDGLGLSRGSRSDAALEVGVGVGDHIVEGRTFALTWHAVPLVLLERLELRGSRQGPAGSPAGEDFRSMEGSVAVAGRIGLGVMVKGLLASGGVLVRTGDRASGVFSFAVGLIL